MSVSTIDSRAARLEQLELDIRQRRGVVCTPRPISLAEADRSPLIVYRSGQFAVLENASPNLLARLERHLCTSSCTVSILPSGCVDVSGSLFSFRDYDPTTWLQAFPAALLPALLRWLGANQVPFRWIGGQRLADLTLPHAAVSPPLAGSRLLEFVRTHDRGVIRYRDGAIAPAQIVTGLHRVWPEVSMAVIAMTKANVGKTTRLLRNAGLPVYEGREQEVTHNSPHLRVTTPFGLASCDPSKIGIAVFLDALEATAKISYEASRYLTSARIYGLLPASIHLTQSECDAIVASFGFDEFSLRDWRRLDRSVEVAWIDHQGSAATHGQHDALAIKRRAIWHNDKRNKLLARLGRQAVTGNSTAMPVKLKPVVPDGMMRNVLMLVESPEHGRSLQKFLGDWPLLTRTESSPDKPVASPGVIATYDWLTTRPKVLNSFACLVRADAGISLPPLASKALVVDRDMPPLLLIDIHDRGCRWLAQRVQTRHRAYLAAGWPFADTPGWAARLQHFVETRPHTEGHR